jgi:ribulose-phosphate 3-epimerase
MTTDICPAILATYPEEYKRQIERVAPFTTRLHIDIADGIFAPNKTVTASDVWWPGGMRADIHVMHKRPIEIVDMLIALGPQLVIVHAEAEGDFMTLAKQLHFHGIEAGVALLPKTPVDLIKPALEVVDHVLIFSGDLGHYGGQVDLGLLEKAKQLRALSKRIEIGWDGGVTGENIKTLVDGGIEVAVSGGYIQKASDAHVAYDNLKHHVI